MTQLSIPTTALGERGQIPLIGLGTYALDGEAGATAIATALQNGYRLLDTAAQYLNEETVGKAIRQSGVPRQELVVTTKLAGADHGYDKTLAAARASLQRLGLEYIDLYLIHWPNPSVDLYAESYRAMLQLADDGLVRHVGVSNFKPAHLQRLFDETGVWPALNQVQLSPALARTVLRRFHAEHSIVTEAWRPLGADEGVPCNRNVTAIARKHGRTAGQIALRWAVQQGIVAIPKSGRTDRQLENAQVFDFELGDADMAALATLDLGEAAAWDADTHEEF
ncbi:MAG TPA: aldo/keto reductase [Micrococcaceae bacterium]|nr:aldo/keto reductase [Micrococcaceae bacterium]